MLTTIWTACVAELHAFYFLQALQSRELHEQLRSALESNANLSKLFTSLNSQLGEILTDPPLGETEPSLEP